MAKRTKTGIATSTKMDKTVVVTLHTYKRHPKYFKPFRTTKKFYAHDEEKRVKEGDTVTIEETRPLSKLKRWKVIDVKAGPTIWKSDENLTEEIEQMIQENTEVATETEEEQPAQTEKN